MIIYICSIYRERVPKRSTSQNLKGFGIFPGAVVERGKDWNYGRDDGKNDKIRRSKILCHLSTISKIYFSTQLHVGDTFYYFYMFNFILIHSF